MAKGGCSVLSARYGVSLIVEKERKSRMSLVRDRKVKMTNGRCNVSRYTGTRHSDSPCL